jgi:hypothetical protein
MHDTNPHEQHSVPDRFVITISQRGRTECHMMTKGGMVKTHRGALGILYELALAYGDRELKKEHIRAAEQLHTNFYDPVSNKSDFFEQYDYAKYLFGFLMDLHPVEPANVTSMPSNRDN